MTDEMPRMSRREMRAKGLLAPVLDGETPLDDLTPTAEIRLMKMTRRQLRELERAKAEAAAEAPATDESDVTDGVDVAIAETSSDSQEASDDAEAARPDEAAEIAGDVAAANESEQVTGSVSGELNETVDDADVVADQDAEAGEAASGKSRSSIFSRFTETTDDATVPVASEVTDFADDEPMDLKAPLLERLKSEQPLGAYEDELEAITDEDEKPRSGLMLIVAILVGVLVGAGIGMLIRQLIAAPDVQPAIDALSSMGFPGI